MVFRVSLKEREEKRILRGHPWIFRNELHEPLSLEEGEIVDVWSHEGRFIGRGFFQRQGSIAIRLFSKHQEQVDMKFFVKRLKNALLLRKMIYHDSRVYRWIHAESDLLPGLVADRYDSVVVIKSLCGFYEKYLDILRECFFSFENIRCLQMEIGGQRYDFGEVIAKHTVSVNDLDFIVDFAHSQKTGMFLDQRENALAAARYVQGKRVFDGHCYFGLWSCTAAAHGAQSVLGVDTSSLAVELAQNNARANGFEHICSFSCADVFEVLSDQQSFDVVFLDPPALAKKAAQREKAIAFYHALHRRAMDSLVPGGILVTSSCSHAIGKEELCDALKRAARAEQRMVKILETRGAAPDHPVCLNLPETEYLTCIICQVF